MTIHTMPNLKQVNLASYHSHDYNTGASFIKRALWYATNVLIFKSGLVLGSGLKGAILRSFGAKVGRGVVIKPSVNIKHPWFLEVGDNVWIGEDVSIDNLVWTRIRSNVCISQQAYLLTGNHNYKSCDFDLVLGEIVVEDGAWIGARAVVCPGTRVASHSVVCVASVLHKDSMPYGIYRGNPAEWIRERKIVAK